jgi:hypothetical protein
MCSASLATEAKGHWRDIQSPWQRMPFGPKGPVRSGARTTGPRAPDLDLCRRAARDCRFRYRRPGSTGAARRCGYCDGVWRRRHNCHEYPVTARLRRHGTLREGLDAGSAPSTSTYFRAFLTSRGIQLPEGTPDDPPQLETVGGLGNPKNGLVNKVIEDEGVEPY